jgi:rhodanese-related sulfurtransferase
VFTRVPSVDATEARQLLDDGALLLDVRRDGEWQAGHAPDARHIPLDQLTRRSGEVPPDRPVVAVCRSGARSGQATKFLRGAGLDVVNLAGGMQAWARAGGDIVRDDGGHGYVA